MSTAFFFGMSLRRLGGGLHMSARPLHRQAPYASELLEFWQTMIAGRNGNIPDMLADGTGALLGASALYGLRLLSGRKIVSPPSHFPEGESAPAREPK